MMRRTVVSPVLPAEYQKVEWIRNTNASSRVTLPITNTNKIDFDIVFDAFTQSSYQGGGGNYLVYGNTSNALSLGVTSTYGRMFIYSSSATGVYDFNYYSKTVNIKAGLDSNAVNKRYFNVSNGETSTNSSQNLTNNISIADVNTIYLFSHPSIDSTQFYCRLRKLGIITNNSSYNLIPCYRKNDNAIGLYDTVNGAFYSASGAFEKGADI